jgi:hypothetical protein
MILSDLDPQLFSTLHETDLNYGYCVRNDDPKLKGHLWNGCQLLRSDLKSEMDGWLSLQQAGVLLDGYSDRMQPIWLSTPTKLYRALSLHELSDIIDTGIIHGGGNGWNGFDQRKLVFFSPAPTLQCIYQGTDLERLAAMLTSKELIATGEPYEHDTFMASFRERHAVLKAAIPTLPFTSAVIETRPISQGFHYSREHGSTGMNGEDEFGFVPGFLKAEQIEQVHWVKDQTIIGPASSLDEVPNVLDEIGFYELFPRPQTRGPSI